MRAGVAGLICAGAEAAAEFTRDHLMDIWGEAGVALVKEGGVEGVFSALEGSPVVLGNNNIR